MDNGVASVYRKPVRIKTQDDVIALGELLGRESKTVEYWVAGDAVSQADIARMSPGLLTSIMIITYAEDATTEGLWNHNVRFERAHHQKRSDHGSGSFMQLHIPPKAFNTTSTVTLAKAKEIAERFTEVVGPRVRQKSYPVVNVVTAATREQRVHDRKILWISAALSFAVSATVAGISWALVAVTTAWP